MKLSPTFHLQNLKRHTDKAGLYGAVEWASKLYYRYRPAETGVHIFERDWDVLIVLDACRADVFQEWLQLTDLEGEFDTARSTGSGSKQWMSSNFVNEYQSEMAETAYITGNPHSERLLDATKLAFLDEVWRYAWDEEGKTVPARPITDQTITAARHSSYDRVIAHYMQPHFPCVPTNATSHGFEPGKGLTGSIWDELRRGRIDKELAWGLYVQNVDYVLDEVELLLSSIDAEKVVITADHGNAFGEQFVWGHPNGLSMPCLREVPWFETSATKEGEYTPSDYETEETDEQTVDDRLEALGYQ